MSATHVLILATRTTTGRLAALRARQKALLESRYDLRKRRLRRHDVRRAQAGAARRGRPVARGQDLGAARRDDAVQSKKEGVFPAGFLRLPHVKHGDERPIAIYRDSPKAPEPAYRHVPGCWRPTWQPRPSSQRRGVGSAPIARCGDVGTAMARMLLQESFGGLRD
jgi:hypothetical protein